MKKLIVALVAVCTLLAASFAASAQRLSDVRRAPQPFLDKNVRRPLTPSRGIGKLAPINNMSLPTSVAHKAPAMSPLRVPGSNAVITGVLVYSDDWSTGDFQSKVAATAGVWNIPVRNDKDMTKVHTGTDWFYTRAAVKVNNVYYVLAATFDGESCRYLTYSTSTWYSSSSVEIDPANIATDLAYDPTTGKVYGFFYNEYSGDYDRFCEFSLSLGEATEISVGDAVYALACNAQGQLYGVTYSGRFVKIDKTTGAQESIGHTGISPIDRNSMAFDDSTGRLYWAATYGSWVTESYSGLFEVNVNNGELTQVREFPYNESFAGLFIDPVVIPLSAPAAVTDIAIEFTSRGALTGTLSFTAPTQCVDGSPLGTSIAAIVTIGNRDTVVENITPGQRVVMDDMTFPEGYQTITITTADDQNRGQSASYTVYVGEDKPGTPVNVLLSERDGMPYLTWQAAEKGLNGGEYDTLGVTYTVTRYPDGTMLESGITATDYTDKDFTGSDQALYYTVTAVTAMGNSDPAQSNTYVFGNGYTVPFLEPFASQEKFDLWTIEDLNGGPSWLYDANGHYAYYDYGNTSFVANDWFISPKIILRAGQQYKLTFKSKTRSKSYPENFKVALGQHPHAADMTTILGDFPNYVCVDGETQQITFSVEQDGSYHLGFHCYSAAQMWQLQITDVGMVALDNSAPAPVDNLIVTAAPLGEMNATVAFTAPTLTSNGDSLQSLTAIKVFRESDTIPAHVFDNPVPGAALSWEDNSMTTAAVYTYRVVAVNECGESLQAVASAFVGVDAPGAPRNLRLVDQQGQALLTWDAPTEGRNGGYFDASNLSYQIWRYDNYTMLVDRQTATTYTDATTADITAQTLVDYVVFPYSGTTRGAYALSNAVIFGKAYDAPLAETFRSNTEYGMNYYPWVAESDQTMNRGWTLENAGTTPVATDQNGDNGMAVFHSLGESAGIHARFSSPKISVKSLNVPQLSFYMYHSHQEGVDTQESIEVEYSINGVDFVKVPDVKFMRDNGNTGWERHSVLLPAEVRGCENLRVALVGTTDGTPSEGLDIYIDNICIDEGVSADLAVTALEAPSRIAAGETAHIAATITNVGQESIETYRVTMTDAQGNVLETAVGDTLAPSQATIVTLDHVFSTDTTAAVTVEITSDADQNVTNNAVSRTITVVKPVIPMATHLEGVCLDRQVNLQWVGAKSRGAVTDSIEPYADFAIDSVGDWTMVDQDFQPTYYINKDLESYPFMSAPKAWQVCNAAQLGINVWPEGTPHSGDKMFMAMSALNGPNNDWLISPELNKTTQVISFFAKAFTDQDGTIERMRVLYSTTDADPAHFTPLHQEEYIDVPAAWTEYIYTVPEGTRYFAIQCVSPGGDASFALFVDDLSFNDLTVPAWDLTGYDIYRNGTKIGHSATCQFTDALGSLGRAAYAVKAVYEQGESAWSNEVVVNNPADLNGDGLVDVSDVNIVIDIVLGKQPREAYPTSDLTGDDIVDVSDVNILIDVVLGR